jgi:hypothetical protein
LFCFLQPLSLFSMEAHVSEWKLMSLICYANRTDLSLFSLSLSVAGSYTSLNEENVYYCPVEFRWWDPQHEPSGAEPEMTGGSYNSLWHEPAGAKPAMTGRGGISI